MKSIKVKPTTVFLYLTGSSFVLIMLAFAYISLAPVDVLKNWTLKVDSTQVYRPGDTISITSKANKVRDVTPAATRYIQCLKKVPQQKIVKDQSYQIKDSDWDGYIILSSNNTPRPSGSIANNIDVSIPTSIPNLPNTCRIYIYITYEIYNFRKFTEYNYSNSFQVRSLTPVEQEILGITPTEVILEENPKPTVPNNFTYSQPSNDPSPLNNGNNFPVPQDTDTPVEQGLIRGTVNNTLNALGGILNGVTGIF